MNTSRLVTIVATILLGTIAVHAQPRIAGRSFDVSERTQQWEYVGRATFGTSELTGAIWDAVDLSYEVLLPDFSYANASEQLPAGANYTEFPLSPTESFIIATRTGWVHLSNGWNINTRMTLKEKTLIYVRQNGSLLESFCVRIPILLSESGQRFPLLGSNIYPLRETRRTRYFYGSEAYD